MADAALPATAAASGARTDRRLMIIALTVTLAAFMEVLDTTIVNVSLRAIAGSLGAGEDESTWVLTAYLVSNGIVLPLAGWLSGLLGRKQFFIGSILAFSALSLACGMATSLPMLILFRLLQGIAGGGLQPSQQAILVDTFPPEKRASAFTLAAIATVIAPILGPVIGGYLTDNFSWRWVFLINVPVGLGAAFLLRRLLPRSKPTAGTRRQPFDVIGLGLVILTFGCLQVVLDKGQQEDWFTSPYILTLAALSFSSAMVGIWWLLGRAKPIIDLQLLKNRNFAVGCVLNFVMGVAVFGSSVLLPSMLQREFGYTATWAGLALAPAGILILLLAPVSRRFLDRVSPKPQIMAGFLVIAAGMFGSSFMDPQQGFWSFVFFRCAQMIALLLLMVPISTAAFSNIEAQQSDNAAAMFAMFRNLGGSIGISLITAYADRLSQVAQTGLSAAMAGASTAVNSLTGSLDASLGSGRGEVAVYHTLQQQASVLAYLSLYQWLSLLMLCCVPLALFLKPVRPGAPVMMGH
jgi:DHA2 family multidrug resistance protein